jgi:adenosylcobinamide kinase/adenosylcobinamide-phosphate guanylyltransferase
MRLRIEKHRAERMDRFQIIEEPLDLASAVAKIPAGSRAAVIDCLTVWLGNLFYHYPDTSEAMHAHLDRFESALGKGAAELFIVTNEVGWGIVPADAISRRYQEIAGWLNRRIAAKADRVYLCVCGIPTVIKETCA